MVWKELLGEQKCANREIGVYGLDRFNLFEGFGHDVAGLRRQTGAFELYGGVADAEFVGYFSLNVGENAFALIEVHVGDPRVEAEGVVGVS